jgi:hypothetical protein
MYCKQVQRVTSMICDISDQCRLPVLYRYVRLPLLWCHGLDDDRLEIGDMELSNEYARS